MADNKTATPSANAWLVEAQEIDLKTSQSGTGQKVVLNTAGKWLDRNIEIAAPTAKLDAGSITSGSVVVETVSVGTKTGSTYAVSGSAEVPAPDVNSAGFVSTSAGTKSKGLASVNATIAAGEVSASVVNNTNGSAAVATQGFTASTDATGYAVNLTTTAGSVKAKADVKTTGYVSAGTETETSTAVSVAVDGATTLYIPEADISASAEETTAASVALSSEATVKTATSGNYKITVSGASTNGKVSASAKTSGTGMVSATETAKAEVATTVATITDEVVYIQAGAIGVAAKDADVSAYTETDTKAVVPSEGYLTISEGYYPATKIALATLVADDANIIAGAYDEEKGGYANAQMLAGATAYDKDGKLNIGTIPTITAAVSAADGQTVVVPAGYIAAEQEVSVANGSVKLGIETKTEDFNVVPTVNGDQIITIGEGWLEDQTITVKAASIDNLGQAASTITASGAEATVSTLTVGTADVANGTVKISGTGDISGTATANTTTAGYTKLNDKTGEGKISGEATVDATLPLFTGSYTLGA